MGHRRPTNSDAPQPHNAQTSWGERRRKIKLRRNLRRGLTPSALAQRTDRGYPEPVLLSAREVLDCLGWQSLRFCVGGPPLDFKQEDFKVFSYMCWIATKIWKKFFNFFWCKAKGTLNQT